MSAHRHECDHGYGAFYECSRRDGCDRDTWTCPECEDDDYYAELTAREEQERRNAHHCEGR